MSNLIYSLNATVPVFLVIVVGYVLKRIGWITPEFIKVANKINFKVTLPCLLIQDLMNTDFRQEFDGKYILYCMIVTSLCFFATWTLAKAFLKDKSLVPEFVQGSFRGSAAVLGTAFVLNMYGDTGMVPLMIIGAVPLYNIYSVIVLTIESPRREEIEGSPVKNTIKGIATNPIIIGIVVGLLLSIFRVDFPLMIDNTIGNIAKMATPLALLAIGGSFEFSNALKKMGPAVTGSAIKLVIMAAVFLPVAVWLGYRDAKLMALVIMLGSPTTPSCYIMAKNMKCDGTLTSSMVVITTMMSAFTITLIVFVLRTLGYL